MSVFTLEHSHAAYRADFAFYASAVAGLAAVLLLGAPRGEGLAAAGLTLAGLASWTLIEYGMHRFVLHGVQPFCSWHEAHHERPQALICAPTILSASLIAGLVFLPMLMLGGLWRAGALTLGVLCGYLAYSITHHATHHWRAGSAWLKQRKRFHALHHHAARPGYYGVTNSFWDHVFGSAPQRS